MQKNNIKPNKLLGQNFLRDKNVLAKIIQAADLKIGDRVLEVGPGLGILTEELAKHAGRVIAVEKDKSLAVQLKEKFSAQGGSASGGKNVEIIQDDILSFLPRIKVRGKLQQESRIWIPGQARDDKLTSYKVVANIPYYLTSHLIRLLLESPNPPQDIVLLVQKEVAKRICAKPPKMSLLAVSVQFYAQPKIISFVSKNAFWPKPKVDSAIIKMTPYQWCHPRENGDPENTGFRVKPGMTKIETKNFFTVVKAGFSQPRKQLLNNLSASLKLTKTKTANLLRSAGLKPEQRAETLTINDWIKIAESLKT